MREMLLSALKSYYVGHINKHIAEIGKYDDRLSMIMKYLERRQANEIEEKKESKSK